MILMKNMNMGPRGRLHGHRGSVGGFLAGLLVMMMGGWIILAAAFALILSVVFIIIPVFGLLVDIAPSVLGSLLGMKSLAIGMVIGLLWYYRSRKNRESASAVEEEEKNDFITVQARSCNS